MKKGRERCARSAQLALIATRQSLEVDRDTSDSLKSIKTGSRARPAGGGVRSAAGGSAAEEAAEEVLDEAESTRVVLVDRYVNVTSGELVRGGRLVDAGGGDGSEAGEGDGDEGGTHVGSRREWPALSKRGWGASKK